MGTLAPGVERGLYEMFRYFNRFMLLLWRLGLGATLSYYPPITGRIMVLIHTGRKSGNQRRTPLNYALIDGDIYCTAGFGAGSAWYKNVLANPDVEVWLPEGWWQGQATDISDDPRRLELLRQVLIGSGGVAPLIGLDPRRASDADLERFSASYRLVRIRRDTPRTGPGGPGDLAWVWPLATHLLLLWLLIRRKKQR